MSEVLVKTSEKNIPIRTRYHSETDFLTINTDLMAFFPLAIILNLADR